MNSLSEFLDGTKIEMNELIFGKTLGEGGFGVVKKGKWKSRNVDVAIKQVLTGLEEEVSLFKCMCHLPLKNKERPNMHDKIMFELITKITQRTSLC